MMYATWAAYVGKELACRLNRSWHWVRKLLQSLGAPSYLFGGGRQGSWKPGMVVGGGGADPRFGGAGGVVRGEEVHAAEMGCTAWTVVERFSI